MSPIRAQCVYCQSGGPFTDEHVLTRAFSGPGENWVLKELVCKRCNTLFSRYERRWTRQPGLSFTRIALGPATRIRQGRAFQSHPSENLFLKAHGDPILYEVDILLGLQPRPRVQFISTFDDVVSAAGDYDDAARFKAAFDAFMKAPEITIQKRIGWSVKRYRIALLDLQDPVCFAKIELRDKPAKAWLDRFPQGLMFDNDIHQDPRLSVDPDGRLRFRVIHVKDIPALLQKTFAKGEMRSAARSFAGAEYELVTREVVDMAADSPTCRAIAKTAVNFAVAEMGSTWISSPGFRPILDFCIGKDIHSTHPPVGLVGQIETLVDIPAIYHVPTDRHALVLVSEGVHVVCFIRLYGGPIYRVHLGPAPMGTLPFQREVSIDYNGPGRVPVR